MNTAWETTVEDVETVLNAHGLDLDADEVHGQLNHDDIEDSALWGDEIEEQTNYAYQEIEHQLITTLGHLPAGTETKFPL